MNLHRGNEDSVRLGPLVHGHCPTGRRVYGGLPRSFGGLMLVEFPWSYSLHRVFHLVWYNTPLLLMYPLEFLIILGVMWGCPLVIPE